MKTKVKNSAMVLGKVAKKVLESATHAAVFAFVSKKVTDFLDKQNEESKTKVRVEGDEHKDCCQQHNQ